MLKVIVDGVAGIGRSSVGGGLGACPPRSFWDFEPCESGSEAF